MTIRNPQNWCPNCEEACHHHPTICSVCGTTLQAAPEETASSNRNHNNDRAANVDISPIPETLRQETREAALELRQRLQSLRQQVQETGQRQQELMESVLNMRQQWEAIPLALMDPQQMDNKSSRPTSAAFLDQLERVVLGEHSSLLYQCTLRVDSLNLEVIGTLGDFGLNVESQVQRGPLILAQPRTGLGGTLDVTTQGLLSSSSSSEPQKMHKLCLMERGDGITFVQKASMAQSSGATACIVANSMEEPWPYVMKDSKGEAQTKKLEIPTVMIPKSAAQSLFDLCSKDGRQDADSEVRSLPQATLEISQPVRDCVVCTDSLEKGCTVLRLPPCGHVFHEGCVLQWLNKHNTCPFCRRELPTDDEEYEQERRRVQRTHAASSTDGTTGVNDLYG